MKEKEKVCWAEALSDFKGLGSIDYPGWSGQFVE